MGKFNIGIILVVYNRAQVLRKALLSILHQQTMPSEILISDDGSGENIPQAIADIISKFSCPVLHVWQEDQGFRLARCRNNAIREAQADYLVFWDQDLIATPGYLTKYAGYGHPGQFLTSFPILLDERQTNSLTEEIVADYSFMPILYDRQIAFMRKQYRKDMFYYYQRKWLMPRDTRPKVRGGAFGAYKSDLLKVNGFDENYIGWGNEDDDLGKRLYKAGIVGKTAFKDEYPIHMYHAPHRVGQERNNQDYYLQRIAEIKKGDYRAVHGISNPLGKDIPKVVKLN